MDITYKILIAGAIIVALGWAAYGIWWYKVLQEEKKEPQKKTEHLDKVKKSFEEYTKKMAEYKLKPYERKGDDDKKAIK
jgi:H+/gluconate symporter-like permease